MHKDARALGWTLSAIGAAILIGGPVYLWRQQIPLTLAIAAALVAGVIEASFYAATGFAKARSWVAHLPYKSGWLAASVLPAYLIYSLGAGTLGWKQFALLVATAVVVSGWYEVLPKNDWTDAGFLLLIAAGLLFGLFPFLYPPLSKTLKTDYIGHIMWLRLSYWAILTIRGRGDSGFGFLPSRTEWAIGARFAVYCIPVAAVLLWAVQPMRVKDHLSWGLTPLVVAGTFIGLLWVVALSEELFFRGMLLPAFTRWLGGSATAGLAATSIAFGLVHLSFGAFPNWRMVLLAGVLGVFCGRAAQVNGGRIRAAMVMHALVVTIYRVLLTRVY